jgi:ABC-type multidrug transport system fused ATPase/permease subunit
VIVLYGGYQAIDGNITAGTVVAFVLTLSYLFEPIQQLSQLYATYQSGMAALEKIFQLLDVEPDLTDKPDALQIERIGGEVSFEGVSFAYRRHGRGGIDPTARPTPDPSPAPAAAPNDVPTATGEGAAATAGGAADARADGSSGAAEVLALDGIDLHIPPGQTVALVGATGVTSRAGPCARRWG